MGIFNPTKYKIVVSDFHLGKGLRNTDGSLNLLEDFDEDKRFIDFMNYHMEGQWKRAHIELVLNGDFFNLLQIDYRNQFTDRITEADALHKTMSILHGHEKLFDQMAEFSQAPHHEVVFILGNHDPGLLWPGVQEALQKRLKGRVRFYLEAYVEDGVWIEHGNHYNADNRYDRKQYFLQKKLPEPIINLPFGSFLVIHYINEIKKKRPYIDKLYPFHLYIRWALIHDTFFAFYALFKLIIYFFSFYLRPNPIKKFNFIEALRIIKESAIHPKLHKEAKRILFSHRDIHLVVFGHSHHHQHRHFARGKEYINSGTWNERIGLELGIMGKHKMLTFVFIEQKKGEIPKGVLKEWKGKSDVMQDLVF